MRVVLLQARDVGDPMLSHEARCFAARCELAVEQFECVNLVEGVSPRASLDAADVVMVGGSGDYSLVGELEGWRAELLDLMREIVDRKMPMFGSCFGFQALVRAYGGTLASDPAAAEVGKFEVTLTSDGAADPLFAGAAPRFPVQLGHNDSASLDLPEPLVRLAYSERAPVQAVRVRGTSVVATQFHPELAIEDNILRYLRYLQRYDPSLTEEEAQVQAQRIHRATPYANSLLRRFLQLVRSAS